MRPWLVSISLATAVVVALKHLVNAMVQLVNDTDRLLQAVERLAGRIRNMAGGILRAPGFLGRCIPRRVAILAVSMLLVVLVWLPWLR
jgi:succinate dehydrogenase/fumarate reductase cytochrome b subunit